MKNIVLTIWIVAGTACALFLFQVKQEVQELERQLATLNTGIEKDEEAIRVLEAEWSYLNRPDRLQQLSEKYLRLEPLGAERFSPVSSINENLENGEPAPFRLRQITSAGEN
ncbi:cell division protein FtsL [Kiloniella sp. b19]|uniref:cell division protein FtsL n=1 Tax=Kiloniella sp. GXU_MW_B19 TaxID=3141326 RepID=UPI0031CED41B